jgi:hypothetical protein
MWIVQLAHRPTPAWYKPRTEPWFTLKDRVACHSSKFGGAEAEEDSFPGWMQVKPIGIKSTAKILQVVLAPAMPRMRAVALPDPARIPTRDANS